MRRGLKGHPRGDERRDHPDSSIFPDEEGTERSRPGSVAGLELRQQHLPR